MSDDEKQAMVDVVKRASIRDPILIFLVLVVVLAFGISGYFEMKRAVATEKRTELLMEYFTVQGGRVETIMTECLETRK